VRRLRASWLGPPALLAALWALLWTGPLADTRITDVYIYDAYARALDAGAIPYSDAFPLEYPPLALAPMWLARAIGSDAGFETAFGVLMGVAALATLAGVARLGGPRAAWLFALTPLAAGAVLRTHFDMVAAAALVAALLALRGQRTTVAFALLGAGAMIKLFPAVLVPVALAWLWGRGERREALRGLAVFGLVVVAISAPFLGHGYVDSYRFHLDRPVQIESAPAVVLYALGGAHVTGSAIHADAFKSNGLVGGPADSVAALFAGLEVAALALVAWLASRRGDVDHLLLCCAAAVVAFVALNKVLSPQYVAWLAPLAALLWAWGRRAPAALLAAGIVLTQLEFPRRYADLVAGRDGVRALVAARDVALVAALAALTAAAAAAARSPRRAAAAPSSAPVRP
jgi:Glycosyltransferase family 87